jgi:predicted enzyme related to lactoylglutathione lyase
MKRVIGLGGIFFKAKDRKELAEWYKRHLGINVEDWGGAMFRLQDLVTTRPDSYNLWSMFGADSTYMAPSAKDYMINFVVEDLATLLQALKDDGVNVQGEMQDTEFGKFGWIMDPEGTKIELWQPA